ncbi:MAG TPA: hypothetical protein VF178_04170 [Gemmatimonadaceae bacterium]
MEIGKEYIERDHRARRIVMVTGYWKDGEEPVASPGVPTRKGFVSIMTVSYNGVAVTKPRVTFVRCERFDKAFEASK